jgi:peptidoglycan/xylan/chitin deacetylase (PgdA/CDA1 family)
MLERVADETKWEALRSIAGQGGVALPAMPPAWCRPMSWDMVRAWAREGVRFGPHTVTHPILAQTPAKQCRYEMAQSWQRLQEELPDPEPIFAFPNGKDYAAGEREARMAAEIGMVAALSTERRSLQPRDLDGSVELARYRLPRHAWPSSVAGLLQAVFGLEDLKDGLRRRWAVA